MTLWLVLSSAMCFRCKKKPKEKYSNIAPRECLVSEWVSEWSRNFPSMDPTDGCLCDLIVALQLCGLKGTEWHNWVVMSPVRWQGREWLFVLIWGVFVDKEPAYWAVEMKGVVGCLKEKELRGYKSVDESSTSGEFFIR